MAATNTFDAGLIFDDTTLTPSQSAVGYLYDVAGGTVQTVYDLNGNPLANNQLITNSKGYCARFKAGIGRGIVSFGSVLQPVVSMEVLDAGANSAAAAASAATAATNSASSASSASSAAASAAASATAAQLAAGSGGTGGGLPAGTTLDQIPNGSTRLAMTTDEKNKIANLPVSYLQIGTTATTAKAGNYSPTPSAIGAVQNVLGVPRIWGRTTAQGFPTTADGALDGDWLLMDAS
jgi:hypothetical protein